jgi:Uma2 family endonuclease
MVMRVSLIVGQFVLENNLGELFGAETGFLMQTEPLEIRAADAAFVTRERMQRVDLGDWLPFPPDLAVEVISEYDRAAEIHLKVRSYMAHGTRLLWVLYPEAREIVVYSPGRPPRTLGVRDTLDGGDVLPGFAVPVSELFAALDAIPGSER